jgi:type I restriction enzyme S subunit
MDIKTFLNEIGYVTDAPRGIQEIRQAIIHYAIQGKLSAQSESDTDVKYTLNKLSQKRKALLKKYSLQETKKHKNIGTPEGKLKLPKNWSWEFLGHISAWPLKDGDWVEKKDQDPLGEVRLIQLADVGVNDFKDKSKRYLTRDKVAELNGYYLQKNDILIARLPEPLGRSCLFPGDRKDCITVVDIAVCRCDPNYTDPKYISYCINSLYIGSQILAQAAGTTRKRIATGKLGIISLPYPPIEEQERIVKKVDELMALCDRLEALQQKRDRLSKQTHTTVLAALAKAHSSKELKKNWNRVQDNMSFLFNNPQEVDEFRSSVMNLAIRGFLNKKSKDDAALLLDKCKKHTEMQIFKKKKKPIKPVKHIKHPFKLPDNWVWTRFSEIGLFERGKSKHRPRNDPKLFKEGKYPFIQTGDVARATGKGIKNFHKQYGEFGLEQSKLWPKDTLCITIAANIADSAILKIDACFPDSVVGFIPYEFVDCVEYFDLFVRTAKSGLIDFAPSTAQKNINLGILEQVVIPLPPKKEMEEIIQFTNHIFSLCNRLQQQLRQRDITSERFVSYYVTAITGSTQPKEKEKMKTPRTELISVLKLDQSPGKKDQAPLATILAKQKGELSAKSLWSYSGLPIDRFYRQLKTEMANGWIVEPQKAYIRETEAD